MPPPRIDVWFDYNCPYSYVGLERIRWLRTRFDARVMLLPFELHPDFPKEGLTPEERDRRHPEDAPDRVRWMIEEAGLPEPKQPERIANTRPALALTAYAGSKGAGLALHERLFGDYWVEARDLLDRSVLLEAAEAAGLGRAEAEAALANRRWWQAVEDSKRRALALGVGTTPSWLLEQEVLVPGAQPHHVFERLIGELQESERRRRRGRSVPWG